MIYSDKMEVADDSDGFESCEEGEEDQAPKKTGNPFTDFAEEIKEVEEQDPDLAMTIKIGRKQIVDFIERGNGQDMEGWKLGGTKGGIKGHPIQGYFPEKSDHVKVKYIVPVPNVKLDDCILYLEDVDKRMQYDEGLEFLRQVRSGPINTRVLYAKQKGNWPVVGPRDFLVLAHGVIHSNKLWASIFSIEDDEIPEVPGLVRLQIIS